jgi:hypothetical protein
MGFVWQPSPRHLTESMNWNVESGFSTSAVKLSREPSEPDMDMYDEKTPAKNDPGPPKPNFRIDNDM